MDSETIRFETVLNFMEYLHKKLDSNLPVVIDHVNSQLFPATCSFELIEKHWIVNRLYE